MFSMSLSAITKKLIQDKSLPAEDIDTALNLILRTDVNELQTAAFLVSARATGLDHTPLFIATTVANLAKEAKKFETLTDTEFLDIVGTGGDGRNTFNVSTTSAIVAAGINGVNVAKHGGPASTSTSGASDLLSQLGVDLSSVNDITVPKLLAENDFVYMSGPVFHPIMAKVRTLRKNLGIPTVFNLVGPLLNPAPVRARVLGVYMPSLGRTYAEAAKLLFPNTPTLVVCGAEGLDEISPAGETFVWELNSSGDIKEYTVTPSKDFGLSEHPLSEVASGTPTENAKTVYDLVESKIKEGNPIRDYVLLNTAALLYIAGAAPDFKAGVKLANESIDNGGAAKALINFKESVKQL